MKFSHVALYKSALQWCLCISWQSHTSPAILLIWCSGRHVPKIYAISSTSGVHVKATCLPKMKKDRKYSLLLTIEKKSISVSIAECSCPAGMGPHSSCKHLATLFCYWGFCKISNYCFGTRWRCMYITIAERESAKKAKVGIQESGRDFFLFIMVWPNYQYQTSLQVIWSQASQGQRNI